MAVARGDVVKVAKLANIAIDESKLDSLANELSSILGHMEELAKVDTERVPPAEGLSSGGQRLRPDHGPGDGLANAPATFAPEMRDGFIIVPRLATHDGSQERSP
ncbi:MAG TPA: Asp-tRNA(Asn)/Glu-tRNA(Gln) amidotransferase subunit GatC [Gemmatimonadaceae bacterium]|nr:Asp-tRNA(Asn)/Glu-tRNA(Gln) amidotransferase subunit GatC [Gemmatimonadaceae bacterium]